MFLYKKTPVPMKYFIEYIQNNLIWSLFMNNCICFLVNFIMKNKTSAKELGEYFTHILFYPK